MANSFYEDFQIRKKLNNQSDHQFHRHGKRSECGELVEEFKQFVEKIKQFIKEFKRLVKELGQCFADNHCAETRHR